LAGSNELNMLLKAKVIKIKVELDYKNSNLPSQVNAITKFLKTKPVKLKVELSASITDLNSQLAKINKTIHSSKSFKPMKIGVEIDIKGSAIAIKNQLKEIQTIVDNFNKNYRKQLEKTQQQISKTQTSNQKGVNVPNSTPVGNYNNIKQYVAQMKEAENMMKSKLGKNQSGLFSSFEIKDAKGNLNGFIATLEKANGVVEKVRYTFDQAKGKFVVVDRSTATATEKMIHRQMQALQDLQRELEKTGKSSKQLQKEQNALMTAGANGTLTADMVKAHSTKIKNTQAEMQATKSQNDLIREQAKLINDINRARKNAKGSDVDALTGLKDKVVGISPNQFNDPATKGKISDMKREFEVIKQGTSDRIAKEKDLYNALEKKKDMINKINILERTTNVKTGTLGTKNLAEVKALAQTIDSMEKYMVVKKRMNEIDRAKKTADTNGKITAEFNRLNKAMTDYAIATGKSASTIEARFKQVKKSVGDNLAGAYAETQKWTKRLNDFKVQETVNRKANSVINKDDKGFHTKIKSAVDSKDISMLKEYIGGLEKAEIATLRLTTNNKGVSKITAQLAGTGKTAKEVSYEIDNLDKKLRFMSSGDAFNRNANLGIFEQLGIAMKRVPVWMVAMTAFHGSIRAVSNMTGELLKIDKAVTNITRVASDNINVDTLIGNAVDLSSELGNNIHDILGAMEEFARTFGDFNERQLTDITKTAVLMSNVSDLTVEESTKSLVGTMNAFNITASDSIRIVDALNEVDNDYAISTKQLAEGLSKSASTAKTFGVSMEESVGHITSIGSVTMESGAIIGNSLKTIYSRITTLKTSESILKGVNVEMYKMGDNGEKKVRPVAEILSSLAGEWAGLTDEQRQNTAVSLAGRYQLSRFLAMMNNWGTATKATRTALTSQGSAMRENAKYMDSYESRINKLKNAFTEFSMSVGDSVLNAGMFTVIEGLTSLAKIASTVIDKFGALPIVFAVLGIIAFKVGLFNKSIGVTKGMLVSMKTEFIRASAGARTFQGALAGLSGAMGATRAMIPPLIAGLKAVGGAIKGMIASTIVGFAFVAIGIAVEKLINGFEKAKRAQEKIKKANDQLIDSYRNTAGGLEALIAKQEKLQFRVDSGAIKEGTDAYNEYVGITNQLAEKMPTIVKYIDQSGLAHLRETDAISKQFDIAKKLSELKALETQDKFVESLDKRIKKIQEEVKESENLLKVQKQLEEADGKKGTQFVKKGKGRNVTFEEEEVKSVDNTDKIQANNMSIILSQQSMASEAQKTMKLIQDTTLAYMESDKQLINMTDTGKKMIETTVQQNENLLMYSDKAGKNLIKDEAVMKQRAEALLETSKAIGEVVSQTYTDLAKGVEDPLQLEEINANMDNVIKSLPDTFFKMESVDDADVITSKFKDILSVSKDIENGSADWDGLKSKLESLGFTSDESSVFVAQLGLEFKNSAIKAQAMIEATEGENVALQEMIGSIEAVVDATEDLFGYKNADLTAMSGHIANMERMIALSGEGVKSSDNYKESLQAVSQYLGIPEATIDKDLAYYRNMADLMGKVELTYDEATGAVTGFNKEGLNKPQIAMLNEMIKLGHKAGVETDALTGKFYRIGTDIEVVKNKQGKWVDVIATTGDAVDKVVEKSNVAKVAFETMFVVLQNGDGSTSAFTNIIGDLSLVNGDVDKLKLAFENLQLGLGTPTGNAVLDGLIGKLDIVDGTIAETKGNVEILKQILGIPANVNLLNDEQLTTTNTKVNQVKDAVVKTKEEIQKAKQENMFNEADSSANTVIAKTNEVKNAVVKTKEEIQRNRQEKMFNEADTSGATVKTKVDEVTTSVQKLADVKVPSGKFAGIYAEMEAGADANTGKLDVLVNSIKKASDSAGILIALDTKIDDSSGKARGLKQSLADALTGFTSLASQSSIIANITSNINSLTTSSQNAGTAIGSAFSSIGKNLASGVGALPLSIGVAISALKNAYDRASTLTQGAMTTMGNYTRSGLDRIINMFDNASVMVRVEMVAMTNAMRKSFKTGLDMLVNDASSLPIRIANAIRANSSAGNIAMMSLARNMASQFTTTLVAQIRSASNSASRGRGGNSGGAGAFGSQSGEGSGSTGGGDSGSSGVMVGNTSTVFTGGYNFDGVYDFHALATAKKPAVNPREGIADAFSYNYSDRQMAGIQSSIALLEIKMGSLNKATVAYRDTMKSIISLSNIDLAIKQRVLIATEKRQKVIASELKKLPALNKQSTKQRESYNKLMQEYDSNLTKINSFKSDIAKSILDIKAKSLEIFADFIGEIVTKYDTAIDSIKNRIDNTEFKIDVLGLTNPDDKKALLNAQADKATQTQEQQATGRAKVDKLNKEFQKVGNAKGFNSKEALAVKEELLKAKEDLEDFTLAVLQAEKEIKDTRASIADEGIKTLQDYHGKVKDMAIEAIDLEKEALQDAHDTKMDLLGEEEEAINSLYDTKLKGMDEEKDKADYQATLDEKNAKKSELLNKIALLSRDSSLEGRKKVADLETELADINKDITETQADRKDELLRKDLEAQKQAQLDAIALEKEKAEKILQFGEDGEDDGVGGLQGLDATKDKITKDYEDLMNNDAYWAKMRDDAILGNFNTLSVELGKMKVNLDNMNKGIFDGLYAGFSGLTEEVKRQVAELSEIDVDNMLGGSKAPISDVKEAVDSKDYTMTNGAIAPSKGTKVTSPIVTTPKAPAKKTTSKKKAEDKKKAEEKKKRAKDTKKKATADSNNRKTTSSLNMRKSPAYGNNVMSSIPKDAKVQYIGMEQGWAKVKYNGKTGYVGAKYLKKFDTGGYTGDWAGNDGKVAMLHKKEVVLNERQTKDILDSSKIMDKITSLMPNLKRNVMANELATGSMSIVNNYELHVNIERVNGDKKGAETVVTQIMKGLKKMGK